MDQQNQNNTPDGSADVPLKRKRGRPRKYPRPDSEESSYPVLGQSKRQNPLRVEQTPVPPGFEAVNGNQHLQRGQENDSNNAIVGQVVSGVVEAVFDAGYLLNVRVGDSDTTLRGLIFKPGSYVPVSPENDVAPGVPMIQRNEVHLPSRTTQFQTPPPIEKNGQPVSVCRIETLAMNGSPSVPQVPRAAVSSSNLVASSGNNVPSAAGQTTDQLARGIVVPVVLQPNNFSNGMPVSIQPSQVTPVSIQPSPVIPVSIGSGVAPVSIQPSQVTPVSIQPSPVIPVSIGGGVAPVSIQPSPVIPVSIGSRVAPVSIQPSQVTPVPIGSGVIAGKEIPVDGNHELTSNAQASQITSPSGMQSEGVPHFQTSSAALNEKEDKSLAAPNAQFEQLVTEVVKRIETPLNAMVTETGNSKPDDNILKDPSTRQEDKINDMDQPILITPLQAVVSHLQENSASAPKASDHAETGKMTELLQNEKTENQESKAAEQECGNKLDDIRNFGTRL